MSRITVVNQNKNNVDNSRSFISYNVRLYYKANSSAGETKFWTSSTSIRETQILGSGDVHTKVHFSSEIVGSNLCLKTLLKESV